MYIKYNEDLKQKAIELKLSGLSGKQIARVLKVNVSAIWKWTRGIGEICHPLYKNKEIKHDYFSPENLTEYPERHVLIGFIAADGCISDTEKGQKRLVFNLGEKDKSILDFINQEISNSTRKISNINCTKSCMIYFASNEIANDLSLFGIIPRKTKTYNLPSLNEEPMRYFLRGYFFGDGCLHVYPNRKVYHLVSTSLFAQSLKEYLLKNNIVKHCVVSQLKNRELYSQILFQGKHAIAFEQFIFHDEKMILLPRKCNLG